MPICSCMSFHSKILRSIVVKEFSGLLPILGVCLGHQAIATAFGGKVNSCHEIIHGKKTKVLHSRKGLYKNLPLPFAAARYHSLVVDRTSLPDELNVEAENAAGIIMGLKHKKHQTYGVQFHPESILTPEGKVLIKNFIDITKDW